MIKSSILDTNYSLVNRVKHHSATLKHINTNIIADHAELTYMLIEGEYYKFTKYRIDMRNGKPYLTDIYNYKEDRWFSKNMRDLILLNLKHTALSEKRHEANRAFQSYRNGMESGDYASALWALDQVPESHRIFNDFTYQGIDLKVFKKQGELIKLN